MRGVKLRAIDNLSLEVGDNEIVGLLGPNGCGKSTTIKIVLGLLRASQGECRIYVEPGHRWRRAAVLAFCPRRRIFTAT